VRELNKKVLGIAVVLMAVTMLAVPVYAKPTNGPNKVAVTVTMTRDGRPVNEGGDGGGNGILLDGPVFTGVIIHVVLEQHYFTTITFADNSTLDGYIVDERKVVNIKGSSRIVLTDNYVFDFGEGGFEGNGLVMLDMVKGQSKGYGLFHGTGDFEGQTLNIGHGWEPFSTVVNPWLGYWLKCQVYP
jgi:hypothetical protein